MDERLVEFLRNIQNSCAERSAVYFHNYDSSNKDVAEGVIGSGVLVRIEKYIFVLTAAHVIRQLQKCRLAKVSLVAFKFGRVQMTDIEFMVHPSYEKDEKNGADIGAVEIKSATPSLHSISCANQSDICPYTNVIPVADQGPDYAERFALLGVPYERVKKTKGKTTVQFYCANMILGELQQYVYDSADGARRPHHDKNFHIAFMDTRQVSNAISTQDVDDGTFSGFPEDLHGISGGGIWALTSKGPRLIAIQYNWGAHEFISGTFAGYALALLYAKHGDIPDPYNFWTARDGVFQIGSCWMAMPTPGNV